MSLSQPLNTLQKGSGAGLVENIVGFMQDFAMPPLNKERRPLSCRPGSASNISRSEFRISPV